MNPVLLKSLIGVGAIGAVSAASVGGYVLLSKDNPKTIREKLKGKEFIETYVKGDDDTEGKKPWTQKKTSYTSGATNVDEGILQSSGVDEKKISDKCKEILEVKLSEQTKEELDKKEKWVSHWCIKG